MALLELEVPVDKQVMTAEMAEFLDEARERVSDYLEHSRARIPGFVPCDFDAVYYALRAVVQLNLAPGNIFCEWGSGFGVVASMAALLGFDSSGIEIESSLVDAARELADEFGLPVEFIQGSFIPAGAESRVEADFTTNLFWLATDSDDAYRDLGIEPDDFDVVFGYPWPGEENVLENLFDHCAADGALLLLYTQLNDVRMLRKTQR